MKIAILFLDNMLSTSALNALELWNAARETALVRRGPPLPKIETYTLGVDSGLIKPSSGLAVQAQTKIDSTQYDVVYIPALWRNPRSIVNRNPALVDWLREQYERGAILNATGTGVCFIAETGLLDGSAATTHWHYFDQFARDYPLVQLKRQHFITEANRIYCAGSINALTDLTIHHVHRFMGAEVAEHLSQHFSAEARQSFDRLRFDQEKSDLHADEDVLQVQLWLSSNIARPNIEMSAVANQFGLSQRTLNRRFKDATGVTPVQYLQRLRYTEACELLKKTNLPIGEVAAKVGLNDASYFSGLFKKYSGQSPNDFRTKNRPKLFNLHGKN